MNSAFSPHRILLALSCLHKQGYEQLRIFCGRSPSGMQWRYDILPRNFFARGNGLLLNGSYDIPPHPSGSLNGIEEDIAEPEELAANWLKEFAVLHQAQLPDLSYAEWYRQMLEALGEWEVPVMYADWEIDFDNGFAVGNKILALPVF